MKKIAIAFVFALVLSTAMGGVASAVVTSDPSTPLPLSNITGTSDLEDIVATVINWVFFIFITIAVVMIILAGLQFVTGGGDPAKVSEARTKLIWAAAGIGIALTARGFEPIVRDLIGA